MSLLKWTPSLQAQDFEIKQENLVYEGFFQVRSLTLRYRRFSGEWSAWIVREQIRRDDAAAVLLYDPIAAKVVLIEQFRVGLIAGKSPRSPWLLEIVAGLLENEEDPESTVVRETQEEAGCEIKDLVKIGEFFNSPGGFAEKTFIYCATVDASAAGGIYGNGAEHEDIRVHVLPFESVLKGIECGEIITSASTYIALQWLALHKESFQT
jgi:ADP-ribose pyrophosphatase